MTKRFGAILIASAAAFIADGLHLSEWRIMAVMAFTYMGLELRRWGSD